MADTGVVSGKPETRSVKIVTDLSDKEYYLCNLDLTNDDEVDGLAADATKNAYILLETYDGSTNNRTGVIATGGQSKVKLGGTVTVNDFIVPDGNGKGIAATADNQIYAAVPLQNGVSGDIIAVQVTRGTFIIA